MREEKGNRLGPFHKGFVTTPFDIYPVPTVRKRISDRYRKLGDMKLFTYKTELEEAEMIRIEILNKLSKSEDQDKIKIKKREMGRAKEKG